jgi:hypothetical protein
MNKAIQFYLEKINPILALSIFLWCFWVWSCPLFIEIMHGNFKWKLLKVMIDSREYYIPMYILIKGLFCGVILWIVGEYFRIQFKKSS